MKTYRVTGLMSGTSLDGLDIAFCTFEEENGNWNYKINSAETFEYTEEWKNKFRNLEKGNALDFALLDAETGHYFGRLVRQYHEKHNLHPDFIASHGQTIFHQPDKKLTAQIGKGAAIAAETGLPVVCDFRSADVALGGQGAPLVPIGDMLLFNEYDYCLNLGGFGNVSYHSYNQRIAFDVCPVNIVLNHLAGRKERSFDESGQIASSGSILQELLQKFDMLPYYKQKPPKSLGKEWVIQNIYPLLDESLPVEDLLRTYTEHIANQISRAADFNKEEKILVTGGGAFNQFLISLIREKCKSEIVTPDADTINFKEALIFAFLGVLRWRGDVNCLKSVTGASKDNCGGAIYYATKL